MENISSEILLGKSVVLIDDDPNSLDIAKLVLESAGAIVTTASNGKEGLECINEIKPVLVISDISMPIMDGLELVKAVREADENENLLMVALTAHAMIGDREKALNAGFNGYITKPLFPATFIESLMQVTTRAARLEMFDFSLIGE